MIFCYKIEKQRINASLPADLCEFRYATTNVLLFRTSRGDGIGSNWGNWADTAAHVSNYWQGVAADTKLVSGTDVACRAIGQTDRSIQEIRRQSAPQADVFIPNDVADEQPAARSGQEPCRQIRVIRLEGHPDEMGERPINLLTGHTRCLTASDINQLLGRLNRWYQERGWITTRVYAVPADLNQGELILKVVPGRTRLYRSSDDSDRHDRKFASAFPGQPGDYLNLRDLEQGLENLNRVPSQEAKFRLYPGEEPGTSDIVIELEMLIKADIDQAIVSRPVIRMNDRSRASMRPRIIPWGVALVSQSQFLYRPCLDA